MMKFRQMACKDPPEIEIALKTKHTFKQSQRTTDIAAPW